MPRALCSERSCFQGGHLEVLGRLSRTSFPLTVSSISVPRSESWDSRIPHRPLTTALILRPHPQFWGHIPSFTLLQLNLRASGRCQGAKF